MIDEHNVREMLLRRADAVPATPVDTPTAVRRARRRLVLNGAVATVAVAAIVVATFAGLHSIRSAPIPVDEPTPTGIFAPLAGRIVYENEAEVGDLGYDLGLWAIDPSGPSDTAAGPDVVDDVASTLVRLDVGVATPLGWSSDGTDLLFWRGDAASAESLFPMGSLYILHADGSETRLNRDPISFGGATISPDGTRVVFVAWGDDLGLWVVDAEGGRPVRLPLPGTEGIMADPTFSPDGTQIAYVDSGQSENHLWVMDADGSNAHEILSDEPTLVGGAGSLQWSPAGDRIVAQGGLSDGTSVIYTFAPDGSDFRQVIAGGFSPYWSPDGSQIAYTIECEISDTSCGGLAIADADGSNVQAFGFAASGPWHPGVSATDEPVPTPVETSTPVAPPTTAPVASGALAYALAGDIFVADPDGSNAVKIADASDGCEGIGEYSLPSWSPDGRYLAFQLDCPSSEQADVVITDPHGNAVAEGPSYGWGSTWSPDSTRVAVWKTLQTFGVYSVDGERQALPLPPVSGGGNDAAPGWMPDGSALLVFGYAVVPLDGSAGHELPLGRMYSPDGTRFAVETGHSIAVIQADGSRVSEVNGLNRFDAWSPDGDRSASLAHGELNVVDVASGTVTVLAEARAALSPGFVILGVEGFSPQGDRIMYSTSDGAGGSMALYSIGADGSDARLLVAGATQGQWLSR
jgi:Tol biopolymer transport system component